jgi:thermitase
VGKYKRQFGLLAALLAFALPIGLLVGWPQGGMSPGANPDQNGTNGMGAYQAAERQDKAQILQRDVEITASLCRLQCRDDLSHLAMRVSGSNIAEVRESLREMRALHPHMHAVAWVHPEGSSNTLNRIITEGTVDTEVPGAQALWEQALRSVAKGNPYESKSVTGPDGDKYFILGVPSREADGAMVGLIHQDVIGRVARNQARNLRLKEYPDEDKRFGIRAVDPKTGQEVDVDTPEENQGISHYKKKEVVVRFTSEPDPEQLQRMKADVGAQQVKKLGLAYVFDSKAMSTKDMLTYFAGKNIEYAEPHYLYVANAPAAEIVPNDELYSRYQWNLPIIETPAGWSFTKGTEEVIVAVVDTGVTLAHPDLSPHLTGGYNVIEPSAPPEDDVGHGTHVAGVISALTDNRQGVAGMTWYNKIMPVKVLDSTGMGSTYSVAEGIIWATDHGANVINLSLGNYASAEFLHDAIRYAFDRDVVLIAATGNDNTSQPGFPAAYPEVLSVSATNMYGEKASFSNFGDYVDVVAPGENIASTYIDNQYAALSGTSMASPHVAALAALVRSANPSLKNTEIYDIIRSSVSDLGTVGKDAYFGYGQISVSRALQLATGAQAPEAASEDGSERTVDEPLTWVELLLQSLFGG